MASNEIEIPRFQVEGVIGSGASSVVLRASRDGQAYAIKVMKEEGAKRALEGTIRFRREAAVLAKLNHPALVRVVEVGEVQERPYLVMELLEGQDLASLLKQGVLPPGRVVESASALAGGLAEVHRRGLVHRDVKRPNVIVQRSGQAKLVDFELVSAIQEELEPSQDMAGTLLYAAPEQTGMLKRPVDGRSDLYALGATLFECATGRPPFVEAEVAALLRRHASEPAPDARALNPALSPALAAVLAKLLAKDPDDRYQTAEGLRADLESLGELEAQARSGPVRLGRADRAAVRSTEPALVGREAELAALRGLWQRTASGTGAVALLRGEPGSGKSRLGRELLRQAQREGALALSARCTPVPLGPVRELVDAYVAQALRREGAEREAALGRLRRAAGELAPLLANFSPGLALALKDVVAAPMAPATTELLSQALADLLAGLARESGRAALLIDDLQALDEGSLGVFSRLARGRAGAPVLLLCTARSEVGEAPGRRAAALGAPDVELALGPLSRGAVAALLAEQLGGQGVAPEVVERVEARVGGNPLAVTEYVHALIDHAALRLADGLWQFEPERLARIELPKDTLGLVLRRVGLLSERSARLLTAAAVVGPQFRPEQLAHLEPGPEEELRRGLAEAAGAGLLEPAGEGYAFVHQQVREALLAQLPLTRRQALHQAMAELLDAQPNPGPQHVFDLAHHYASGEVRKQPRRVFETSRDAGQKALEAWANPEAYQLLTRASVLGEQQDSPLAERAVVEEALGLACVRTGRLEEALTHLDRALALTDQPAVRARVHLARCRLQMALWNGPAAFAECLKALEALGQPFADAGSDLDLAALRRRLAAEPLNLGAPDPALAGPALGRAQLLAAVYGLGAFMCWSAGRTRLVLQLLERLAQVLRQLGARREAVEGLQIYACVLGALGHRRPLEEAGGVALRLAEQAGDRAALAAVHRNLSFGYHASGDFLTGERHGREAVLRLGKWLLPRDYLAGVNDLASNYLSRGHLREAAELLRPAVEVADRARLTSAQVTTRATLAAAEAALGGLAAAAVLLSEARELAGRIPTTDVWNWGWLLSYGAFVLLEQGDLGERLEEHVERFAAIGAAPGDVPYPQLPWYMHLAWCRLRQYQRAGSVSQRVAEARLRASLRDLRRVAREPFLRSQLWVMLAALERGRGRHARAGWLLDRAQAQGQRIDGAWTAIEVGRERALLARAQGREEAALVLAREAREGAARLGWRALEKALRDEFGLQESRPVELAGATTQSGTVLQARAATLATRHLDALLKVSLASASTLDPQEQARAALDEVIAVLGAERAFLFLCEKGGEAALLAGRDGQRREVRQATAYSTTAVRKVFQTRAPLVVAGTDEASLLGSESAVAHDLRSIMVVPLLLRGELLGALYVDHRLARGLFTEEDTTLLAAIANHLAVAVEIARMAQREVDRRLHEKELEKELELTGAVQALFLPQRPAYAEGQLKVAAFWRPAARCGGDWWWFQPEPGGPATLVVGDVTGHGAAAAMVTAAVGMGYRICRRRERSLEAQLRELHEGLLDLCGGRYNMTLSALQLDPASGRFEALSAGAPPLLVRRAGGRVAPLAAAGAPLGGPEFAVGRVQGTLEPGDRLLVFTDGLSEFELPGGRQLGTRRLAALFAEAGALEPEAATAALARELDKARGGVAQADDLTYVVVSRTEG